MISAQENVFILRGCLRPYIDPAVNFLEGNNWYTYLTKNDKIRIFDSKSELEEGLKTLKTYEGEEFIEGVIENNIAHKSSLKELPGKKELYFGIFDSNNGSGNFTGYGKGFIIYEGILNYNGNSHKTRVGYSCPCCDKSILGHPDVKEKDNFLAISCRNPECSEEMFNISYSPTEMPEDE